MTFTIIDKTTGEYPTEETLIEIAKNGGLMDMDIDGFAVQEDGTILLLDDCGNMTYCDMERFIVQIEEADE